MAAGLILNPKYISGSANSTTYLSSSTPFVLSFASAGTQNVYLPSNPFEGQIVFLKQLNGGVMRVTPYAGQKLFDDSSENAYYDISEGQSIIAIACKASVNNVSYIVWIVNRIKY